MSRIVIGDVHGCYKTLMALIAKLPPGVPITFAGDLVDRGPDSRKVVRYVIENGHDCVQGNHESMMIEHVDQNREYPRWHTDFTLNGGEQTLKSYNGIPEDFDLHTNWMRGLPLIIEYPNIVNDRGQHLVVSHSSCGAVYDWDEEVNPDEYAGVIQWGRETPVVIPGVYNVFGHTPQKEVPTVTPDWANVDTGCCFKNRSGYGKLSAIQFPEMIIYQQENIEDEP